MPDQTTEDADEIAKEAYFDLTTHPSEAGPKGAALLDEYLKAIVPRIAAALASRDALHQSHVDALLGSVKKENPNTEATSDVCKGISIHGKHGCPVCHGWNAARQALLEADREWRERNGLNPK